MAKVYVFLAEGFEEIEGLTPVDLLRRAGAEVTTVSVAGKCEVEGSHKIKVIADSLFEETDFSQADLLVLPGGMPGTIHLGEHEGLAQLLKESAAKGIRIAAICAAPRVLGQLGLLQGKKAVCYPGNEGYLTGAEILALPAVTDGQFTTGRGMGASAQFGLELVKQLFGSEEADALAEKIVLA